MKKLANRTAWNEVVVVRVCGTANLLCEIGKKITRRERPCVALREELDRVPRRLPQLQVPPGGGG
jgi:hypothetical protein